MFSIKKMFMIVLALFFIAGISGCKKEGPAESAGKKIDDAMDAAKKKMEETTK